ncbi:hypothetical protein ACWD6Z_34855, partial [Streptomyces californicus]
MPTSPTDRTSSVPDFSDVPLVSEAPAAAAGSAEEWRVPPDQFGRHCVVPLDDGPRADGGGAVLVPGAV